MKPIGFDSLFDRLGTADIGFCAGAAARDGEEVDI